ncbi:MAG: TRAP transporter small permease, partial [Qingshengfaniella sp.]
MTAHATAPRGPGWFRIVDRVLDSVAGLFQTSAEIMMAIMLVINMANIVLRNIGQPSLLWVSPWTGVLMVWAVFLAFYVMYRRHLDIALMILVKRFGPGGMRMARGLTAVAGLIVAGILLAEAPQILRRQRGTMELIGLTRYWLSIPLLMSCAMLILHFLAELCALCAGWSARAGDGDEEGL